MFNFSLRQKLLLVSSLILIVPWLGIRYVQAIEDYLQHILLDNLTAYTQSVATNITAKAELIPTFPAGDSVFAPPLRNAPALDGYDADWGNYSSPLITLTDGGTDEASPELKLARHEDTLYFFITVRDANIRYHQANLSLAGQDSADGILLELMLDSEQRHLVIVTEAPGLVYAQDAKTQQRFSRIQGAWREREQGIGYQVEFKIPVTYAANGLNLVVNDTGPGFKKTFKMANTTLPILSAPDSLRNLLQQFGLFDGRRISILDSEGRMLASTGSLSVSQELKPINPLFAWLLIPDTIADPWVEQSYLLRSDIQTALAGEAVSQRTRVNNSSSLMLSSAWPIQQNNEVLAVVLVEESTAALQVLQRSALASMLNISLIIFLLLAVTLIAFAGRLSNRIRLLETVTDQAIDKQGRVQGELPDIKQGDELDDLNNHIRAMLIRLRAYHDYLEKLAARLSHELRTPVAVVRSSLENMQSQLPGDIDHGIADNLVRANEGIIRLQTLMNRMAEASRLEQSIHESSMESLDINKFLAQMVNGYRDVYASHEFDFDTDLEQIPASGELLAQALDKLIANAVSFAKDDSKITISARSSSREWLLAVTNQGPSLPEGMESQLFQSMVSIRDVSGKDSQPHLGLGLHIVQLIAEFHGGYASAENLHDGVVIMLHMPRV